MELKHSKKIKRLYALVKTSKSTIGFFYGASSNKLGGCEMVLILSKVHFFMLIFVGGIGTITKDELLSLWGLLQFAVLICISYLCIFGDSKVTI